MNKKIRKPAVAGLFYPNDADELRDLISELLERNKPTEKYNNIFGIVAPHAGYIYSGNSAAYAYNTLKENSKFTTAIVLSPSHHVHFNGCSIYDGDFYETPLGLIPINKKISELIVSNSSNIVFNNKGHEEEHALEVQLPFLQMINDNFDIVPIVIGNQSVQYIRDLSNSLSEVVNERTIIVASSDLSHFHNSEQAYKLDNVVMNRINNFEFSELYSNLTNGECEACGGGAIVSLMETAKLQGFDSAKVLSYTDSGDVTNDKSSVVGYLSAVVYK